jgi:hypothetical protein
MKNPQRITLVENHVKSLPDNVWYEESDILEQFYNICDPYNYSRQGIRSMLKQIIVNSPYRESFGSSRDLFIQDKEGKGHKLRKYIPSQDVGLPHYYINKEKVAQTTSKKKSSKKSRFEEYKTQYYKLEGKFEIPTNPKKVACILECSGKKTQANLPANKFYNSKQIGLLGNTDNLDLFIMSAGYGLISENFICPQLYDLTFKYLPKDEALNFSKEVGWREQFDKLSEVYDKIYILLGDKYVNLFDLRKPFSTNAELIFMVTDKFKDYTSTQPKGKNVDIIYVNGFLKDLHSTSNFDMKGKIINDINKIKPLSELKIKEIQYYIDNGKL